MLLIDSHIHLNAPEYEAHLPILLENAKAKGIAAWVMPGTLPADMMKLVSIAEKFPHCFYGFGVHPWFLEDLPIDWESRLISGIESYTPIAIGECGLDFADGVIDAQFAIFEKQVKLSERFKLPLIIHSYKAVDQVLKILRKYPRATGVFHGFNGSVQQLMQVLDLGFYVGFGGAITYPRANRMRTLLAKTPLDRLLLETDGPYQAGRYRQKGEIHQPSDLVHIAHYIAEQKSLDVTELAKITSDNAINLFNLEMK